MSKLHEGDGYPEFQPQKGFESRIAAMRREIERAKPIREHRAKMIESLPHRAALTPTTANEAEAKRYLESMASFSPSAEERPSPRRTVPYPFQWRHMEPARDIEWYGPDPNTGHCGARLLSQAQGKAIAYCAVGVPHENHGSSIHTSSVSWTTLLGFCDAGGAWPGWAESEIGIILSVDIHEGGGQREYASTSISLADAYVPSTGYDSSSYSENGSLSLSWRGNAGATFSVWATAAMRVDTFGPFGAQANLHVFFTDIHPG